MSTTDEMVPCYTAACPECKQVVCVAVADVSDPMLMRHTLKEQAKWVRQGLTIGQCTVVEIRTGAVPLGHTDECVYGKRKKRPLP